MKKIIIILAAAVFLYQCTPKKQHITFENLAPSEFNIGKLMLQGGKTIDSIKRAHDSCMGISFDANVILVGKKDSVFIGSILNRQSMQEQGSIKELGFDFMKLASQFNILANPCYEKREIKLPLKSVFSGNNVQLPGADAEVNKELNQIIKASQEQVVQTGSWTYLDMNQVIINILDTINTEAGLKYREKLLDSSNMFLSAVESISSISFMIQTDTIMSTALRTKLGEKPAVVIEGLQHPVKFFLIAPDQFQVSIDGFFPVIGKFMKAVLKTE